MFALPRVLAVALLLSTVCAIGLPASEAASVTTVGLVSDGEGTIGHGSIEPAPAPFDASDPSIQLASHPQEALLFSVYTLLVSRDLFDTTDGSEAPLGPHAPPFAGHGTADAELEALGVSGTVYYAFRGLQLDHFDGNDYTYDLVTNVETRIYRGGEIEFYYDAGSGPTLFAGGTDMVLQIQINWNTLTINQTTLSVNAYTGPGILALFTGSNGVSSNPVQTTGTTTEGAPYSGEYGVYHDDGTTWDFSTDPVTVERVSWGAIKRAHKAGASPQD